MAVVPTYGQPRVGLAALPGARKTASETALSEGAGVEQARAGKDAAGAGLAGQAAQIGFSELKRLSDAATAQADDVALLNAQNQIYQFKASTLYDPQTGALAQKGKDTFGLPEKIGADYQTATDKIAAGLTNDRQRSAFAKMRQENGQEIDLTVRRHVAGQIEDYDKQELGALVDNAKSAAIASALDPRQVGVELTRATSALSSAAGRMGWGPQELEKLTGGVRSDVHVGVIDALLANDKAGAAQTYFEETKHQINGEAIARVEAALQEGTLRKQAQTKSDEIVSGGGTLAEWRAAAKKLEDPKLRDAVTERLEHESAVQEAAKRQTEEQQLSDAYASVGQYHDTRHIPPAVWNALGTHQPGLLSFANSLVQGVPVRTDLPTYYSLITQAHTDPAEFAKLNLNTHRVDLDEGDFKQMANLQASIRGGDLKPKPELAGILTNGEIVKNTLTQYGIDPNAKPDTDEGKAVAALWRTLDQKVSSTFGDKKPTNKDVQDILDGIMTSRGEQKGSWWGLLKVPSLGLAGYFGAPNFFDTPGKSVYATTRADVPETEVPAIESALKAAGRPITDATVLELYRQSLLRKSKGGSQ